MLTITGNRRQNRRLSIVKMTTVDSVPTEKPSSVQPGTMYQGHAPYQRFQYPAPSYNNINSQGKYARHYGGTQLADAFTGLGISGHNPMAPAAGVKPVQNNLDINGLARAHAYGNNPLMVLPSGQTIPLQSFYGHGAASAVDQPTHLQYIPTGMFPNFVSNTNMMAGSIPAYGWPYSLQHDVPGLDANRRGSWSSNDENGPTTPGMAANAHQDYYANAGSLDRGTMAGFPYATPSPPSIIQPYVAGPMQPMKCADNKNYESVNLDVLTQQHPAIPRAVPALWTNQEDLSLAKCLQNPEGITNIYIRGFLPEVTDQDVHDYAARFGEIESCKAIVDMDTGKCKGYVIPTPAWQR
jgi:RNA recognition motif. (a.k.a. RRM, RBD, or RNP domain)